MDPSRMNPLAVIIPSRNGRNLGCCVERLRRTNPGARIIAVWDRSGDHVPAPSLFGVEVIELATPFLYANSVNAGIRFAEGHDVVLLNDDALLNAKAGFDTMQTLAAADPGIGLIAATADVTGYTVQHPQFGNRLREAKEVAFVCVLIPRRTIDWVGLVRGKEGVYGGDDNDYCWRVRRAGLKVMVYDGCYVNHSTLPSTFRPNGEGLSIEPARRWFREMHGFEMGSR